MVDPWDAWNEFSLSDPVGLDRPRLELFAIGWLRTEVNNGGFNQLFFDSAGDLVPVAVEALRREGAAQLADLVVRAMAVLGDRYPSDRTARQDTLEAGGDDVDQRLEALDEELLPGTAGCDQPTLLTHLDLALKHDDELVALAALPRQHGASGHLQPCRK